MRPLTTMQPDNQTLNVTDWLDRVSPIVDTNATPVLSGTNFFADCNNTSTPDDALSGNHSALSTLPTSNGSDSIGSHVTGAVYTSSVDADIAATIKTFNGTMRTDDRRALTTVTGAGGHSGQNSKTTESATSKGRNPWFPLPPWIFNSSVAQQNILEELLKKDKDKMVRIPPGRQLCIH